MICSIFCIGKIKEKWMREGIDEYLKRLTPFSKVEFIQYNELKMPAHPSQAMKEIVLEKEGELLLKTIKPSDFVILLDLKGKMITSEDLADTLEQQMVEGKSRFCFVIGGPYGNGENIRKRSNLKIAMGHMTFTHQMTRLLLLEQIYRAMKIIHHEPYHL